MDNKQRALQILSKLQELYLNVETTLENWNGVHWRFLFAVMMSAQTTDKQVNSVTKLLFQKYPTLEEFANAKLKELEQLIRPVGFHKIKAKYLRRTSQILLGKFRGKVPLDMKDLESLPGVGRKTASVVTGVLADENFGVAVDTHVARLSRRLELTEYKESKNIEKDLMKVFSKENWNEISLFLIMHGRSVCRARNPQCEKCILKDLCNYPEKNE